MTLVNERPDGSRHVALGPGRDFGEIAEGFLRFSFAATYEDITRAMSRLGTWLGPAQP